MIRAGLNRVGACAALAVAASAAGVPDAPQPVSGAERVWSVLERARAEEAPTREQLVADLADLGPGHVHAMVAILIGLEPPPSLSPEEARARRPGDEPWPREELLLAALECLPGDGSLAAIGDLTTGDVPRNLRLMGIRLLGDLGGAPALDCLVASIAELEEVDLRRVYVQKPIVEALARILDRDVRAADRFAEITGDRPVAVLAVLARGVGASRSARGLALLARWLGEDPELDRVLIDELAELAGKGAFWLASDGRAAIREYLAADDVDLRCRAAVALARLHDVDSVDALIDMLEDDAERVRYGARWALETLSGVRLASDPGRWRKWYADEERWQRGEAPTLEGRLDSTDRAAVIASIGGLARHRLYRHRSSEALLFLLEHTDPAIAAAACAGLAQLGSPVSIPALRDATGHPRTAVQEAAAAALVALGGPVVPELGPTARR